MPPVTRSALAAAKAAASAAAATPAAVIDLEESPQAKRTAGQEVSAEEPPPKKAKFSFFDLSSAKAAAAAAAATAGVSDASSSSSAAFGPWEESVGRVFVRDYGSPSSQKVAGFDMDSTVIRTKSGNKFAHSRDDWTLWSPEVGPKMREFHDKGYKVVLITNQGGIAAGRVQLADIKWKIDAIQKAVGAPMLALILAGEGIYRKPFPKPWNLIEAKYNGGVQISKADSFYCGDAAGRVPPAVKTKDFSNSDLKFALNVGVSFQTPEECFQGRSQSYARDFKTFDPRKLGLAPEPFPVPPLTKQTLVLCVGAPGCGKSTLATRQLRDCVRVNQDILKTKEKCHKAVQEALQVGKSVVVDNQNKGKSDRAPYLALAKAARASVIAVYYDVPKELCFHLNTYRHLNRESDLHRPQKVPPMIIHSFYKNVEKPTVAEGFEQVYRVGLEHFAIQDGADTELLRSFLD